MPPCTVQIGLSGDSSVNENHVGLTSISKSFVPARKSISPGHPNREVGMQLLLALGAVLLFGNLAFAHPFLVENGEPRSEIIIAEEPPRLVKLAAEELQTYLEKISGARLPILTEPSGEAPFHIFVGKSPSMEKMGIDDADLRYGAYRIVSDSNSLVLLGHDADFVPKQPAALSRNDYERALREWDALTADLTDGAWSLPMASTYRAFNNATQTWAHDQGGSLNAVYGFLRSLGVRWYLPGELGEVFTPQTTITLSSMDLAVHPDYALRQFLGPAWSNAPEETVLWSLRMGLNHGYELLGVGPKTHGLGRVLGRPEMKQAHPEYYALINGERDISTKAVGHACWSSERLVQETVNYARAIFDIYDEPTLQLSPADGLKMCQCEDCSKLTPSDAVWGFLDRVAKEVAETHPDHLLIGAAYTSYRTPPESITSLQPNIAVRINNVGRPSFRDPAHWEWYQTLVEDWRSRIASQKIIRVENNYHDTVLHPRMFAQDLQTMKGISLGEMNEVDRESVPDGRGQTWGRMGTNHLNRYINSRFLWDADQEIETVLQEYYDRFYGPASEAMKTAFTYAETNYTLEGRSVILLPERIRLLELLHQARQIAGDTIYGHRIQFIIDEFDPLDQLREKLAMTQNRGDVIRYRPWSADNGKWVQDHQNGKIDGKLEERFWQSQRALRTLKDGGKPALNARFQLLTASDAIWIGGRCDVSSPPPSSASTLEDDPAILEQDRIEFLLETDAHAFYRIVISSSGAILDEDRSEDSDVGLRWKSNAEVAVHHDDGFWSFEARIPIVTAMEGAGDPIHHMIYQRPPTTLWPWYFNLGRILPNGETVSFAPNPDGKWLDQMSFGKLAR